MHVKSHDQVIWNLSNGPYSLYWQDVLIMSYT